MALLTTFVKRSYVFSFYFIKIHSISYFWKNTNNIYANDYYFKEFWLILEFVLVYYYVSCKDTYSLKLE